MANTIELRDLISRLAGSPGEITKELNKHNLRYVKTRRGCMVKYIIRGKNSNFKTIIKL